MILNFRDRQEAATASWDQSLAVNVGDNKIICRVLSRWTMYVDSRDMSILPQLSMRGMQDPAMTELLCGLVKPGMTCVDVGACFGYQSLLLSELVGESGRVFSFEPHPRVFGLLKRNLENNGFCPKSRPYPNALGAASGTGELLMHRRLFGGATLSVKAKASFGEQDTATVNISRLDEILTSDRCEPDLYIISTNGYEPEVFSGMSGLLGAKRKVSILMDFTPRWYLDPGAFIATILDQGFIVNRVDRQTLNLSELRGEEQFMEKFNSVLLLTR